MPWTFPSGLPIKVGENGQLLGGTYTPPSTDPNSPTVEGDPEAAKQVARALGMPGIADMIDKAAAGQNPFSSNISILPEGVNIPGMSSAVAGDINGAINDIKSGFTQVASNFEHNFQDYAEGIGSAAATSAVDAIAGGGAAQSFLQLASGLGSFGPSLPLANELEQFASMNCLFGLGCISAQELNFPDRTYRKNGVKYGQRVLKSGGTPLGKPRTYAEQRHGVNVGYYIDDVSIDTVISPNPRSRATNFYQINFNVYEPYSMGQFLQTLQLTARNAGYNNYLEAPYLLTLEFVGYDDNGNIANTRPIRKMLPLKFVQIHFNVDGEGSRYEVLCSVFNDEAFLDANQSLPIDVTVSGRTLQEITQTGINSIATHINTHLLNQKKESKEKTEVDEYIIAFPSDTSSNRMDTLLATMTGENTATTGDLQFKEFDTDQINAAVETSDTTLAELFQQEGREFATNFARRKLVEGRLGYSVQRGNLSEGIKATIAGNDVEPNAIGSSPILTAGPLGSGRAPFGVANFAWNPENGLLERKGVTIDPQLRTINFKAGTKIQKILEELVLLSDYGKKLAEQLNTHRDGMIDWFRIEAQVYLVQDNAAEKVLGRMPRIYLYRVVPYKVHRSIFQMPNDTPPGYDQLYQQAAKRYDYMYTGQNKNILKFDIQFDNAFFESISADSGNRSQSNNPAEQANTNTETPLQMQGNSSQPTGDGGMTVVRENRDTGTITGGATVEDPTLRLARQFNEAVVNSAADLISIEMEILGDPYFIADSGAGNYNAMATPKYNVNADGTINHQSGEVDIIINFRTPIDLDPDTGGYLLDGASIGLKDYSGLYKVLEITNRFSNNMFTQTIQAVRRRNIQSSILTSHESRDRILEEEERWQARVDEARESGDEDAIAFAIADKNADGVLQYWEVPNAEEAARLNAGVAGSETTGSSPNQTPSQAPNNSGATAGGDAGDGLRGGSTSDDLDAFGGAGESVNTTPSTQQSTTVVAEGTNTTGAGTGATSPSANDVYFKYGGGDVQATTQPSSSGTGDTGTTTTQGGTTTTEQVRQVDPNLADGIT